MARLYGLNGLIRGRQGNNVYSIQNGTQVLKVYNPAVSNPRTAAQQMQRAKFALAGKLSSATPSNALVGMPGSSNRSRRGDYVSRIVRASVASASADGYQAQVAYVDILFSIGSVAKWSPTVQMAAEFSAATTITATMPAMNPVVGAPQGYGELVVIGLFDGAGSPLDNLQAQGRVSGSATNTFLFHLNTRTSCVVAAWVIPYVTNSRDAALRAGNLGLPANNDGVLLAASTNVIASSAEFGNSLFNNLVLLGTQASILQPDPLDESRTAAKKK